MGLTKADIFMRPMCRLCGMASSFSVLIADLLDAGDPADDAKEYIPLARPGSRAPHAWLGEGRSILDLFGRGFVLLQLGPDAPDGAAFESAATARGIPLKRVIVKAPTVAELYGRRLVLVRPDGHVAWRGDEVPPRPADEMARVSGVAACRCQASRTSIEKFE
jgi:hypothetical protein